MSSTDSSRSEISSNKKPRRSANVSDAYATPPTAAVAETTEENLPQKWSLLFKDGTPKETVEEFRKELSSRYGLVCKKQFWQGKTKGEKTNSLTEHGMTIAGSDELKEGWESKALDILEPDYASPEAGRKACIVDGLQTHLAHTYDLVALNEQIMDLFQWHDHESTRNKYLAPYLPLVQSSGMGKTKLLYELRIQHRDGKLGTEKLVCKTVLCVKSDVAKNGDFYDAYLTTEDLKSHENLWDKMDKIIGTSSAFTSNKIVLLFDEAQGLMNHAESDKNIAFRSVRWWLREERKKQVVAVFAGTTAKLSNFFPTEEPPSGASRNATRHYKNYDQKFPSKDKEKRLYPPFFKIHTISCLHDPKPEANFSEMARAIMFGRPLFAYYLKSGSLDQAKLEDFQKRLVLSSTDYKTNVLACFSVLGSRVQMGILGSFEDSSKVVSSGYACLVNFQQQHHQTSSPNADISFLPDPLCALLAMHLMHETGTETNVAGQSKEFWVRKAKLAYETQLCRPEKGDVGEVFVALYMLFCADLLRSSRGKLQDYIEDRDFRISVDLHQWFRCLKLGRKEAMENKTACDNMSQARCTVSFIQFCRNYLRSDSFCTCSVLDYQYKAGVGVYVYSYCKAIDLTASIQVSNHNQGEPQYHPLLVSVKNRRTCGDSDVSKWMKKMESFLKDMREGKGKEDAREAVCLLVLIGCEQTISESKSKQWTEWTSTSLDDFPSKDVYRFVCVPDDMFGINAAVQSLGLVGESSEAYASHSFMIRDPSSPSKMLRSKSKIKKETGSLCKELRKMGGEMASSEK